jgi:hypothetical protein
MIGPDNSVKMTSPILVHPQKNTPISSSFARAEALEGLRRGIEVEPVCQSQLTQGCSALWTRRASTG